MNATKNGLVYDAAAMSRILGFPAECSDPVPEAAEDEIVIYYGGWDLKTLRNSPAGQARMCQNDRYDGRQRSTDPAYYNVLLPVPASNGEEWSGQVILLRTAHEGWQPAPVCVAATALLVHLTETGNNVLKDASYRCAETVLGNGRVILAVRDGRVDLYDDADWPDRCFDDLWLAASRKS